MNEPFSYRTVRIVWLTLCLSASATLGDDGRPDDPDRRRKGAAVLTLWSVLAFAAVGCVAGGGVWLVLRAGRSLRLRSGRTRRRVKYVELDGRPRTAESYHDEEVAERDEPPPETDRP
ncbi:MAG: hypothetical protein ACRDD1_20030 [Planctomycetia bacterium]